MFQRATTFWRPNQSGDESLSRPPHTTALDSPPGMTRAEARARARCEPLTPAEFKARRRVAEQGLVSLSDVLDEGADARGR